MHCSAFAYTLRGHDRGLLTVMASREAAVRAVRTFRLHEIHGAKMALPRLGIDLTDAKQIDPEIARRMNPQVRKLSSSLRSYFNSPPTQSFLSAPPQRARPQAGREAGAAAEPLPAEQAPRHWEVEGPEVLSPPSGRPGEEGQGRGPLAPPPQRTQEPSSPAVQGRAD